MFNGTQPFRHGSNRILLLGPNFSFDNKTQRDSNLDPVSRCAPFVVSLVVVYVDVTKFILFISLSFSCTCTPGISADEEIHLNSAANKDVDNQYI